MVDKRLWSIVLIPMLVIQRIYGLDIFVVKPGNLTTYFIEKLIGDCTPSATILSNGNHPCKNELIFEDRFDDNFINQTIWNIEQYTPITYGEPDYEFVSYEHNDETLFIRNSKLIINPIPLINEEQVKGTLDLREECTASNDDQCFHRHTPYFILPPVKSAKITSKFSFIYGIIEVQAKLPLGNWIYPHIQLLPKQKSKEDAKMWIAYARGNSYYIGPSTDIGSKVLFGGLVLGSTEPKRSRLARKRTSVTPYGDDIYVYTLIWEPEKVTVLFNGKSYGSYPIDMNNKHFSDFAKEFYLSIGVGVGGINDFPDNYTSSNPKPWINGEPMQLRKFFNSRDTWLTTWKEPNKELQIESVKIWAL